VKLSSIEEQTIHVRILQTADKEISQLNSKAIKFRELTKRMTQQLLTRKSE
jgi:restriction endonuclease S subunit